MASLDDMTVRITVTSNLITMGKKYTTRDGRAVRILATDFDDGHDGTRVIGIVPGVSVKGDRLLSWDMYGNSNNDKSFDLIPIPVKHQAWAWFSGDGYPLGFCGRSAAEIRAGCESNQCAKLVTWGD